MKMLSTVNNPSERKSVSLINLTPSDKERFPTVTDSSDDMRKASPSG